MRDKEKVPLRFELKGTAKQFYEDNTPEEACDWVEGFINSSLLMDANLSDIFKMYGGLQNETEATIIGAVQKLIDTIRAHDSVSEGRPDPEGLQ